jgi:hypothetical protein
MHATREVCSANTSRFLWTSRATISTTVERYLYSSHRWRHSPRTVNQDLFPHGATAQPIAQWPFFVARATGGLLKLRFRCPLSLASWSARDLLRNSLALACMKSAPQLARCGGNRARSRSLSSAPLGMNPRGPRCVGDLLRNLLAVVWMSPARLRVRHVGHGRRRSAAKPEQSRWESLIVSCGTTPLRSRR